MQSTEGERKERKGKKYEGEVRRREKRRGK